MFLLDAVTQVVVVRATCGWSAKLYLLARNKFFNLRCEFRCTLLNISCSTIFLDDVWKCITRMLHVTITVGSLQAAAGRISFEVSLRLSMTSRKISKNHSKSMKHDIETSIHLGNAVQYILFLVTLIQSYNTNKKLLDVLNDDTFVRNSYIIIEVRY